MADGQDSSANDGRADGGDLQMPGPGTALRILELVKNESGAEEWALWLKNPLVHAVRNGDENLTAALLDAGADACDEDSEGLSMLGVAAREGHVGIISVIATRQPNTLHHAELGSGYGALHRAAKHNKTGSIDALVEAGADVELKDPKGWTALHVAAATADCEAAVEALLRHGADEEQPNTDHLTPLLQAVRQGNEAAATVLIEAGASVTGGHDEEKVLELAILGGSMCGEANRPGCISIMRKLVECGVNVGVNDGGALHWAAFYDNGDAVDFLVDMGADVEAKHNFATPFHTAAQNAGNLSSIRALARNGADIHARKLNGDTPLHVAAGNWLFEQSAASVDALLRAGADETMVNAASETPAAVLERAVQESEYEEDDVGQQIRKLLANAPADRADRAWARRSFVVMCYAFPGRVRLLGDLSPSSPTADSTTNSPKRAALHEAGEGEPSSRVAGANRDSISPGDFSGAMGSLMGLQAEVFRVIVGFL